MNVATLKPRTRRSGLAVSTRFLELGVLILFAVGFVLAVAPHALGQGCAMCYQNAASSGAAGRTALRHGILILLLPALSLFLGIFFLIYRRDSV